MEDEVGAALASAVGDVGCEEDGGKGDEVGRGGKGLGGEGGVAHAVWWREGVFSDGQGALALVGPE